MERSRAPLDLLFRRYNREARQKLLPEPLFIFYAKGFQVYTRLFGTNYRKIATATFLLLLVNVLSLLLQSEVVPLVPLDFTSRLPTTPSAPRGLGHPGPEWEEESVGLPPVKQRSFKNGYSSTSPVHFSSYRVGPTLFTSLALTPRANQKTQRLDSCRWQLGNGSEIVGHLSATYPGESHGKQYEVALFNCSLPHPPPLAALGRGGALFVTVGGEEVAVMRDKDGSSDWIPHPSPFPTTLTLCSAPMYGELDGGRVGEWVDFHRSVHGVEHFHFYDAGGLDEEVMQGLMPLMVRRQLDVADIRDTVKYDTWLYTQVLVVNDCALRTRATSKWTVMIDVDEYINVASPPHHLLPFLESPLVKGRPWVTMGSMTYKTDACAGSSPNQWPIERMVFHDPKIYCKHAEKYVSTELCLKWDGHRKYVIDPRKVNLLQIHQVMESNELGLNALSTSIHVNHYRGLGIRNHELCKDEKATPYDHVRKGLVRDSSVARMALLARRKA